MVLSNCIWATFKFIFSNKIKSSNQNSVIFETLLQIAFKTLRELLPYCKIENVISDVEINPCKNFNTTFGPY